MARRGSGIGAVALVVASAVSMAARPATATQELPPFTSYVVDAAGVVQDDVERQLDATLRDYQARTSNQVAVAIVRTTGGRPLEEYSLALANTWALGQEGRDNGVLVLVAYDDRRLRIEVGRGLESVLTDQAAAGIIDGGMVQRMRQGDVAGAVAFAADSIRRVLGDPQAPPAAPVAPGPTFQTDARPADQAAPNSTPQYLPAPYQPAPYQPVQTRDRADFPGWIVGVLPVVALFAVVSRIGGSRGGGYRRSGPMFWGGMGTGHGHHGRSWGSSHGSFGGGTSTSGGGGGGGGGGSFGGGGASGSW